MYLYNAILIVSCLCGPTLADYWTDRQQIIDSEVGQMLGSDIVLTAAEEIVNRKLMEDKYAEYNEGFEDPSKFAPARHFFDARADIEQSPVFEFLKNMPKGASLHGHDTALSSFEILYNLTYEENLYACTVNDRLKLYFFAEGQENTECAWELLSALRGKDPNYDDWLKSQLTLIVDNPKIEYSDINTVWSKFSDIFMTVTPMLTYQPVFVKYFQQVLQEYYDDNIMYMEFRGTLPDLYDLSGKIYTPSEQVGFYKEVTEEFVRTHEGFIGAKFIYAPLKRVDNDTVDYYVSVLQQIKLDHGDFVAGFDLVGQEDLGLPLIEFLDKLQNISRFSNLYFHAGETNWYGSSSDFNLIDAILLGTKRIGHGYAILKHPELMKMVKERGIAIEVNPISNQVLLLVDDIRNHPAAYFLANALPVVVCNDDPTYWGARALSYDWYELFMGAASREADLKMLKKLAWNSMEYSSLTGESKQQAMDEWNTKWNLYIESLAGVHNNSYGLSGLNQYLSLFLTLAVTLIANYAIF